MSSLTSNASMGKIVYFMRNYRSQSLKQNPKFHFIFTSAQNSASNGTTPSINDVDEDRSATLSSPSLSAGNGGTNGFGGADSLQEQLMSDTSVASEPEAEASSLIKLTNGDVLYLREVNR